MFMMNHILKCLVHESLNSKPYTFEVSSSLLLKLFDSIYSSHFFAFFFPLSLNLQ